MLSDDERNVIKTFSRDAKAALQLCWNVHWRRNIPPVFTFGPVQSLIFVCIAHGMYTEYKYLVAKRC